MRSFDIYAKVVLTVIALLLAWTVVIHNRGVTAVHAQSGAQYSVEVVSADWSGQHAPALAAAINKAAAGRELISLTPHDQSGRYLAIFRQQAR
jgi:hypothetical protein